MGESRETLGSLPGRLDEPSQTLGSPSDPLSQEEESTDEGEEAPGSLSGRLWREEKTLGSLSERLGEMESALGSLFRPLGPFVAVISEGAARCRSSPALLFPLAKSSSGWPL
jgi:hypothetical protein